MRRRRLVMTAVLALSVLGACGDGDDDDSEGGSSGSGVTVENSSFAPQSFSAKAGDTVTWTFKDAFDHTVTADDKSFDSGGKKSGDTFDHTFPTAGTFTYKCTIHTSMTGTVTVS